MDDIMLGKKSHFSLFNTHFYTIRLVFLDSVLLYSKVNSSCINNTDLKEVFPFIWIFQQVSDKIHKF